MKVFSHEPTALGEAPLWHPHRKSLFWLDILNRQLFEKDFSNKKLSANRTWRLPEYTSAMAHDRFDKNVIWMVTDKSFGSFDLVKGTYQSALSLDIAHSFRANDGGVSPDGAFWFGTMEWSPSGLNGGIYSISPAAILKKQDIKIGIPNTFGWSADGKIVYISDSFQQKIFSFEVENHAIKKKTVRLVVDLSMGESTPDGGATDIDGYLWNAHWDGHKVVKYDHAGELHQELHVPVPRPTSCCFGGPENRHLFVTSASTGMSEEERRKYPLSGNVFVHELASPGQTRLPFNMDN
jgi:sugar lactone lactonase YvrE